MEITTPGRICLFGEHSDYLGLPIIAMAMWVMMAEIEGIMKEPCISPQGGADDRKGWHGDISPAVASQQDYTQCNTRCYTD